MQVITTAAAAAAVATKEVHYGCNLLSPESPVQCNRCYVVHRDGAGIITLRGVNCQCRARYKVTFGGNIAVATGGTVGPISVAIAIDGEPLPSTTMTVKPAAVGDFFNVSRTVFIDVPCGCCVTIAVENASTTDAGVAIPIDVANANIVVERVA